MEGNGRRRFFIHSPAPRADGPPRQPGHRPPGAAVVRRRQASRCPMRTRTPSARRSCSKVTPRAHPARRCAAFPPRTETPDTGRVGLAGSQTSCPPSSSGTPVRSCCSRPGPTFDGFAPPSASECRPGIRDAMRPLRFPRAESRSYPHKLCYEYLERVGTPRVPGVSEVREGDPEVLGAAFSLSGWVPPSSWHQHSGSRRARLEPETSSR